jgi:hypothetical protein
MVERRQESRTQADIAVRISGRAVSGKPFAQSAVASSISGGGALLSGMERQVRTGDLVWVEYEERKGPFQNRVGTGFRVRAKDSSCSPEA